MIELFQRNFDHDQSHPVGHERLSQRPGIQDDFLGVIAVEEANRLVAHARTTGHADGFAEGRDEASTLAASSHAAQLADASATLVATLTEFEDIQNAHKARVDQDIAALLRSVFAAVLPTFAQQRADAIVTATVLEAVRFAHDSPTLTVRAPARLAADLDTAVSASRATPSSSPTVTVNADPTLGPGCVEMSWTNGSLTYDLDRTCALVLEALTDATPAPSPQTTPPQKGRSDAG